MIVEGRLEKLSVYVGKADLAEHSTADLELHLLRFRGGRERSSLMAYLHIYMNILGVVWGF
ncbi:hypothetical protein D3C77_257570 [compost metagenome]